MAVQAPPYPPFDANIATCTDCHRVPLYRSQAIALAECARVIPITVIASASASLAVTTKGVANRAFRVALLENRGHGIGSSVGSVAYHVARQFHLGSVWNRKVK
ncbi:hypothetical protein Ddc_15637 [Ditylenchus destructor]|nr:hypothetical protein Ddc_15637 [Ditylenchus destructor]